MKTTAGRITAIILFAAISITAAPADKTPPLSLEDCIRQALDNSPLLQASRYQHQASLARIRQAKALSQPSLDFDSDMQPKFMDFKGSQESYLGISQSLEFPGKRGLRGQIAAQESHEIQQEIDLLKQDVTFQVKESFYRLLLALEKLKYANFNLDISRRFQEMAELKYETGDAAKVEMLRARVEAAKAANEVRTAENEVRLAKARLNFLLQRKKYDPLEIEGDLKTRVVDFNLDEMIAQALTFRPELKKIDYSYTREKLMKKQAIMSYLPDFDLSASRHRINGEGSFWDFTLSFPIPLFFWQPKKGEIAEAEANMASLDKETEHLKNSIALEVEEAVTAARTSGSQIQLYEDEILEQAEEAYNMFLFSYKEGEISGIELIDARRTLIEARTSYADALYNYRLSLAAIEKSVGQTLEGALQ